LIEVNNSSPLAPQSTWLMRGTICVLAVALFAPSIAFEFSGWDDNDVLARNPRLLDPTIENLAFYWTHSQFDLYVPVTQTVWWMAALFARATDEDGATILRPGVFHSLNVLLHALAGLGCFELLRKLVKEPLMALAGAAIYVAHPLQVETVCWASATKDLLAGVFGIAALVVHTSDMPGRRRWWIATLLALAAMLSKPSAVTLPAIAILLDTGLRGVPLRAALLRCLPWIIVAIPVMVVAKLVQQGYPGTDYGPAARGSVVLFSLGFYLVKLVWPMSLAFDYGHTPAAVVERSSSLLHFAFLTAVSIVCAATWKRYRPLSIGLGIFFVAMLPVLGLLPFYFQIYSTVGDHYVYLGMLGAALIAASLPRKCFIILVGICIAAIVLSSQQARTWRSVESMARHNLTVNPGSWSSMNNLAPQLAKAGDISGAISLAERARALKDVEITRKTHADVLLARAEAEAANGDPAAAIATYHESLALNPRAGVAWTNLAATLAEAGRLEEALAAYEKAAEIDSTDFTARVGMRAVKDAMENR